MAGPGAPRGRPGCWVCGALSTDSGPSRAVRVWGRKCSHPLLSGGPFALLALSVGKAGWGSWGPRGSRPPPRPSGSALRHTESSQSRSQGWCSHRTMAHPSRPGLEHRPWGSEVTYIPLRSFRSFHRSVGQRVHTQESGGRCRSTGSLPPCLPSHPSTSVLCKSSRR